MTQYQNNLINEEANIFPIFFPNDFSNCNNEIIDEKLNFDIGQIENKKQEILENLINLEKNLKSDLSCDNQQLREQYKNELNYFHSNFKK